MPDSIPPAPPEGTRPTPPAPARTATRPPASRVRTYTPGGTARMIERAPWYATVTAAAVDLTVIAVLGACLYQRRLQSTAGEVIALLILAGVAGVRIADIARSIRGGGPPTGAGPTLALVALLAQAGHWVSGWVRVVALGALVVLAASCTSGPRSPNDTASTVVKVATLARATACDDTLDTWLGRTPPLQVDRAPETALEVVGQIRAWLCADALAGLLDTARELLTPRPSPDVVGDAGTRDASPSAETDAGATAATDAEAPPASPGAPDDGGAPPTAASDPDAGPVTP